MALVEGGVEGTGVDADADRHRAVARFAGHRLDVLGLADVAGVEAQTLDAGFQRRQGHAVLMVDVGDHGHRRTGHDVGQPFGRLRLVARAAHDVAAGRRQGVDLLEGALDVGRLGDRHRLHGDRRATTHGHGADVDLLRQTALGAVGDLHQSGFVMSRYRPDMNRKKSTAMTPMVNGISLATSAK